MHAKVKSAGGHHSASPAQSIRASVVHLAMKHNLAGRHQSSLSMQLGDIEVPSNPEHPMDVGTFLECLNRIDPINGDNDAILQAGPCEDLGCLGLVGQSMIYAANLWSALPCVREGLEYFQPNSHFDIRITRARCRVT